MCKDFRYRIINFFARKINVREQKLETRIKHANLQKSRQKLLKTMPSCLRQTQDYLEECNIICHAGGGVDGQKYLNTLETFEVYYKLGCKCFEYDVIFNGENFVLSHDGVQATFTVEDCLKALLFYSDVNIIFDLKDVDLGLFIKYLKDKGLDADKRIVVQVKNETEILSALTQSNYAQLLLVNMISSNIVDNCKLCIKYGIKAVSFPLIAAKNTEDYKLFIENGIKVFVYTVNDVDEYARLKANGVSGVYSDYLNEEDLERRFGVNEDKKN